MGRAAACLWAAGGVVTLFGVVLFPGSDEAGAGGMGLWLTVAAFAAAITCLLLPWERIDARWFHVPAPLAFAAIFLLLDATDGSHSHYIPLLFVAVTWVAFFLSLREALAYMAAAIAGLAVLAVRGDLAADWEIPLVGGVAMLALILVIAYSRRTNAEAERRLHDLAHQDSLTGLPNRRALEVGLERELARAGDPARGDRRADLAPLALLMVDLDGFKEVNDQHGHAAGDEVLCAVARSLTEVARGGDLVARLGGDEFAIVAPASGEGGAARLADRIVRHLPPAVAGLQLGR